MMDKERLQIFEDLGVLDDLNNICNQLIALTCNVKKFQMFSCFQKDIV